MLRHSMTMLMMVALWCATGSTGLSQGSDAASKQKDFNPVPRAPLDLLYAREYLVDKPMTFLSNGERQEVRKGFILVIKVDLDLVQPCNSPDYVLFGDCCTLQKVNSGYKDGYLIVITPEVDLAKALLYFGDRLVPERMTKSVCGEQLVKAERRGIKPFSKDKIDAARKHAGERLHVLDMNELWFETRTLILDYAPAETEMAMSLRKGPGN